MDMEKVLQQILTEVAGIKTEVAGIKTEVVGIKEEHGALLRALEENARVTRATVDRMQIDFAEMKGSVNSLTAARIKQDKILELMALKVIEHEAEINDIKRTLANL